MDVALRLSDMRLVTDVVNERLRFGLHTCLGVGKVRSSIRIFFLNDWLSRNWHVDWQWRAGQLEGRQDRMSGVKRMGACNFGKLLAFLSSKPIPAHGSPIKSGMGIENEKHWAVGAVASR